jgi:PKD repeat protein
LLLALLAWAAGDRLRAGELGSVAPMGATPGVAIQITGTGFDPTAANNEVTFTLPGASASVLGTAITTLDATRGLRRLRVTVPPLPVGRAALRVRNLVTGETSEGLGFEILALAPPEPAAAPLGASGLTVRLVGSPNTRFEAGNTRAAFGAGITVVQTLVESPTVAVATIAVATTAALGPRTVGVLTTTQTLVLPAGFSVVAANQPPVARPGGPYSGTAGQAIGFDGSASSDPDGDALSFEWDFGDGTTGTGASRAHTYAAAGRFTVRLTVRDGRGGVHTAETTAVVAAANQAPVANAGGPYAGEVGVAVRFDGSGSSDPDQDALTFTWSFGDGSTGQGDRPLHVYSWPGTFEVTLTVADGRGGTHTAMAMVTIAEAVDRSPPVITLSGPAQTLPDADVTLTAQATDNVGVASVTFEIDGAPPTQLTAPPYQRTFKVPALAAPGTAIRVRATARDAAGNAASAEAAVAVAAHPDLSPPTVTLRLPTQAAPGGRIHAAAIATDNAGVSGVVFLVNGVEIASRTEPPFDAVFQVPADAAVGSVLTFLARATDYSGNRGEASGSVAIVGTGDTTPPALQVSTADTVVAGTTMTIAPQAEDENGVVAIEVFVNGVRTVVDVEPPFEVAVPVPPGLAPGTQMKIEVRAIDFAGQVTTVTRELIVQPAGRGVLTGEVYDDTTGLPVEGASVALAGRDARGLPYTETTTTDARGRYVLGAAEGEGVVRIAKEGWTEVDRVVQIASGKAIEVIDARLTPLAAGAPVSPVSGGTVAGGGAELIVPPGALGAAAEIRVTPVGGQGLQGLLPLGWSPIAAVDVAPAAVSFTAAASLDLPLPQGVTAGTPYVLARWDAAVGRWRAVEAGQVAAGASRLRAGVQRGGQYAWVVADQVPAAPPAPAPGDPLAGVAPIVVPDSAQATVHPQPQILFYQPGVKSEVSGRLESAAPLPSGTLLLATIRESYQFFSQARANPEPLAQDLVFYQRPGGPNVLSASHVVSPSLVFEALTLEKGVITVSLHVPGASRETAVVAPEGSVVSNGTARLHVPAGAVGAVVPVQVAPLSAADLGVALPVGLEFLDGVLVTFVGAFGEAAALSVPRPAGLDDAGSVLLARVQVIGGETRLVLVGTARIEGDRLVSDVALPGSSIALEGVRTTGRYVFLRLAEPFGFAAGTVSAVGGGPFAGALVSTSSLPLVALSQGDGRYVAAAAVGAVQVTALDLQKHDTGSGQGTLAAARQVLLVDLNLAARPPTVVRHSPAAGAANVPLSDPIVVEFSEPIDPASATPQAVQLADGAGAAVAGTIALSDGNRRLTFRPAAPLAPDTAYTFTLASTLRDLAGYGLTPAFTLSFTSLDVTPPPPPPAGSLSATIPDARGQTTVRATQGTAGPRDRVFVVNATRGTSTPAVVEPNGGFLVFVAASPGDRLKLQIVSPAGRETVVDLPRFRQINPDGSVSEVVGTAGGRVEGPAGLAVDIPPGALPEGTVVTVRAVAAADFPVQLDEAARQVFSISGGIELDFGGAALAHYVNVSMPAAGGETADDQWVVGRVEDGPAGPFLNAVDTARLIDGRITTSSPPCPGVTGRGVYGFLRSSRPVGVAYTVVPPEFEAQIFAPNLSLPVPLFALPYVVSAPFVSGPGVQAVCYPVLSGRVTANPNAFTVKVAREAFTLADREIVVENRTRGTEHRFPRNLLEVALRVAGAPTDQLEVTLVTLGTPVPVARYRVDDDGAGRLVVRLDPNDLDIPFQQISIRNVTRNTTTLVPAPDLAFETSVPGRATDTLVVQVVDGQGNARPVVHDVIAPSGQLAEGNLRLRALPGTIDPTRAMIDAWNAAHPDKPPIAGPAVVALSILDQSVPGGREVGIPLSVLEARGDGSLDYAFDADRTDQLFFSVRYEDGKVETIRLPSFRVVVTNRQIGRVIRIVDAPAPPRGLPMNLGFTTGQRPATVITSGPSSFSGVDPASGLTFSFSDRLDGASVSAKTVVVERLSQTGQWVGVTGQVSLSGDGRSVTFRADGGLPLGETFRLRLNGVTDTAGQAVLAPPELRFDTFRPRKLCPAGAGSCLASITVPDPTTGRPVPMRDVEPYTVDESGQIRRRLVALSSSDTGFKVFNIDVTDPGAPIVGGKTGGGRGKKRVAVVGPVTFALGGGSRLPGAAPPINPCDPSAGTTFSGILAVTTSFTADTSYLSFFDVTRLDRVCDLASKTLTVTPGSETDFNRKGTIKASGYALGLAVVPVVGGLAAYAAVGEVGLMAVEVHRNIPDVPPLERQLEGQLTGNYVDVLAVGTDLYAIEATANRLDRIDPNLALLDQVNLSARPRRLAFASQFPLDLDGDGTIVDSERRDVLAVATDAGIDLLDVSRRHAPQFVASVSMPGRVRDVVLDPARRRAYAAGDATPSPGAGRFFIVDVASPTRPGVIWSSPIYPSDLGGIDVDRERGYAYVTHPGGIDVYTLGDNCCDLGIELTVREFGDELRPPTGDRTAVLATERTALQKGILAGLSEALATCGGADLLREALDPATRDEQRIALLEQGSGACLWRGALGTGCDGTYQPGVSDHDIEVLLPPQVPFKSENDPGFCLVGKLNGAFKDATTKAPKAIELGDGRSVTFEDVTFFAMAKADVESGRLPLDRPPDTGGSDAVGDMGLGRQQLLLKWVLEGEYVRLDDYSLAGQRPTVGTIDLSGAATGGRNTLAGRDLDAVLDHMRTRRLLPPVEGYEWAVLQEFNLAKSGAFVRIRDASRADSVFRGLFVKQLHDVAKSGIRAALARMIADQYAAQLVLETRRSVFQSAAGCVTVLLPGEGPTADDPSSWATESCGSFEEYIAAVAARDLQRRGAGAVFSLPEVRLIHRFFRVKSDKPDPALDSDQEADRFIQDAYAFIKGVQAETKLVYLQEIQALKDRGGSAMAEAAQRESNLKYALGKLAHALVNGSIHVVPRVFNSGQRHVGEVSVQMYRRVSGGTGTLARSQPVQLDAGASRALGVIRDAVPDPGNDTLLLRQLLDNESVAKSPLEKVFQVGIPPKPDRPAPPENPPIDMSEARAGSYEAVVFTIDVPARSVPEANRQNNVASFVYYILDRTPGAPAPPLPSDPWPFAISRATLLAPSPECRESPTFVLTQNANNDRVRVSVMNTSGETLSNVTVCSGLAGRCSSFLGTLAPGQGGSVDLPVANPPQDAFVDSVVVVTGTRPDGTSVRLTFTDRVFGTASPIKVALYDSSPLAEPDHPWSRWLLSHRPPSGEETPIVGATTDGTPRSVRIEVSGLKPNEPVELLLEDGELGAQGRIDLGRLEGGLVDWGMSVMADALGRATVYYTPPAVFLRDRLARRDFFKQERFVRLNVHQADVGTATTLIALRRPPVFLVHGLFGDIDVFDQFEPLVPAGEPAVAYQVRKGFDGRFDLFNVGEAAATSDFAEGGRILTKDIAYSLAFYQPGFAIGRIDLVGHSMGGVLSRWITNGDPRIRDAVRKIVTINSPLRGSPVADKVVELREALTIQLKAMEQALTAEQFFYDVWKKSVGVALDGQPPGVAAQAKEFFKLNTCASVLQKVGRLPKFNLYHGAIDDLQTTLTRPDGSPSAIAQLIAGGIQAPTHSLVTTMTTPALAAKSTGEVGLLWGALGLLCNLTPDATTVETTTLLQLGAEAVKTVVSLGRASSKVEGPARVRELLKVWVGTDDFLWKKTRENDAPTPVLRETQNDRIVEYTSQLGGKTALDPSVTEVVGNDHQEVKISPGISWRYCVAYDADARPRFDAGPIVRDYNGDRLPDPACRVIELLEADPRGPLFAPRLVP